MRKFILWDKVSPINGVNAAHFLNKPPFKGYNGDIVLIYSDDGARVTNVESKEILAEVYGISAALPLDEFMAQYFAKVAEANDAGERT